MDDYGNISQEHILYTIFTSVAMTRVVKTINRFFSAVNLH